MSCLGVLFSLDAIEVEKLKSFDTDEARLDYLQEEIETLYFKEFPERIAELDKSWDALHRCLTDGKLLYTNGVYPLSHVILGGEILYYSGDYIMTLKTPLQVKDIAMAIERLTEADFQAGYNLIDTDDYGFALTEDDFGYTWAWFEGSKDFWQLAKSEGRFVLFTVDQ